MSNEPSELIPTYDLGSATEEKSSLSDATQSSSQTTVPDKGTAVGNDSNPYVLGKPLRIVMRGKIINEPES